MQRETCVLQLLSQYSPHHCNARCRKLKFPRVTAPLRFINRKGYFSYHFKTTIKRIANTFRLQKVKFNWNQNLIHLFYQESRYAYFTSVALSRSPVRGKSGWQLSHDKSSPWLPWRGSLVVKSSSADSSILWYFLGVSWSHLEEPFFNDCL